MMNVSKRFTILITLVILIICNIAKAGDPCDEVKAMRKERLAYDIEMRKKRVGLDNKIIELRQKASGLESKMIKIEEEIINASGSKIDALWNEFDAVSAERDKVGNAIAPLNDERTRIRFERTTKKAEMKLKILSKRLECATNDVLNDKLKDVIRRLDQDSRFTDSERNQIKALAAHRMEIIETLKNEEARYRNDIATKLAQYQKTVDELKSQLKKEDELDATGDKQYDSMSISMEELDGLFDKKEDELSDISKEILKYHLSDLK